MTLHGAHFLFKAKIYTVRKKKAQVSMNSVTVSGLTNTAEVWSLLIWKNLECFSILIKIYLATLTGYMLKAVQRCLTAIQEVLLIVS